MLINLRISHDELKTRKRTVVEELGQRKLDALVLFKPPSIFYLTNFAYVTTERPIALVLTSHNELAVFLPRSEQEHAEETALIERVEMYEEYPGLRPPMGIFAEVLKKMGLSKARIGVESDDFRLIPAKELLEHLRQVATGEGVKISEEALARIARAAEGSGRDALSLFDQVLSFSGASVRDEDLQALLGLIDRELLLAASQGIAQCDSLALLDLVERLSDYGADLRNFTRELTLHFRELLLLPADQAGHR